MRGWRNNLMGGAALLVFLGLVSALGGPAILLVTLGFGVLMAIAIHELGHAFAGALTGLRVTGLALGPYELDFATKRLYPRWTCRLNACGISIFEPADADPAKTLAAWQWTVLAGPAANLALSFLLGLLNLALFAGRPEAELTLALVACISVVVGVCSLIPKPARLTSSDGNIIWRLWTNEVAAANDIRARQLGTWLVSPVRPRDWSFADLAIADALLNERDASATITAVLYKYRYLADNGDLRGALPVLEAAAPARAIWRRRDASDPLDLVIVLLARHYALWGNDPTRAQVLLGMLHPRSWVRTSPEWQMTAALLNLSKGDRATATARVAQAREQLKPLNGRIGVVAMELAWLDRTEQRIANQMTAPSVAPSVLKAGNCLVKPEAVASHRPPRLTTRDPSPEPQLSRPAGNGWQEVAGNQPLAPSARQATVESAEAGSWLYRAPGVPLESNVAFARISGPNSITSVPPHLGAFI